MAVPALLRERHRDGRKLKKRTIANLSDWPTELVEGECAPASSHGRSAPTLRAAIPAALLRAPRYQPGSYPVRPSLSTNDSETNAQSLKRRKSGLRGELFNEGRIAL